MRPRVRRLWAIICRYWQTQIQEGGADRPKAYQTSEIVTEVAQLGAGAELLLRNATLHTALKALEAEILGQWRDSGAQDGDKREWLWLKLRTVDDLPQLLHGWVDAARIEKDRKELADLEAKQGKYK